MIDYDALLAPIETAPTPADARRAVWAVLKQVRHSNWEYDDTRREEFRNVLAAIDAAAWVAGLSEGFRGNAVGVAWNYAMNETTGVPVIPASFPETVYA